MLQNLGNFLSSLILLYFLGLGTQHLQAEEVFLYEDHCLAYKTEETILLFIDSIVTGKTCELLIQADTKDGKTRFTISFPISSLDSGVVMRDNDVEEMLSVESNTEIRFVSDFLTQDQIVTALSQGKTKLGGVLEVAGQSKNVLFPLTLSEQSGKWLVTGKLVTSLSEFGLELPSVLGGVVADTHDYLELLVHLRFNLLQGLPNFQSVSMN